MTSHPASTDDDADPSPTGPGVDGGSELGTVVAVDAPQPAPVNASHMRPACTREAMGHGTTLPERTGSVTLPGMSKAKVPPLVQGLVDAHCHLDYPPMSDDLAATLDAAAAAGVVQILHVGCSIESLDRAMALADADPRIFVAIGIHPHEASGVTDAVMERLRGLAAHPRVLAIGETGMDYHYNRSTPEEQRDGLVRHAELAKELDLPLVLHIRDAHDEAIELLRHRDLPRGAMVHCFTGTPADAERWLELDYHLSFSGIATFPKATPVAEAARICPLDRILLETDAPYLAPVPVRGRKNQPANVAFTCTFLAGVRGVAPQALALDAAANTRAFLAMPQPDPPHQTAPT